MFKTMFKTKTLIEKLFDDEHYIQKSKLYDLIKCVCQIMMLRFI